MNEKLPKVTDLQLAELRRVRESQDARRLHWPCRITARLTKKGLIEWQQFGFYRITPLGFDVLSANAERRSEFIVRRAGF